MRPTTHQRRGSRRVSILGLAGYGIAGITALVGLTAAYEGIIRLSLPAVVIGVLLVLMAAFLSLVLPDEMRKLAQGRAGPENQPSETSEEMARESFASEHRRRRIAFGITALPLSAILFLVGWSIFSGGLRPTFEGLAAVAFVVIVLVLIAISAALAVITDRRFAISEAGFVPRRIPVLRALRGHPLVGYEEVAGVVLANDPGGNAILLRLVDGTVITLHERDGIPKAALGRLVEVLRARGLVPSESS